MKKFTDTHKKWALTATMIAALGCSVSFNSHTNGFASLDLASESDGHKLIQVPTSKGMLDVHLIATGDKTTAVTSPMKDAEGKATFDCKKCIQTMILDKKITDNVADIQVAVMAQLVKAPTTNDAAEDEVIEKVSEKKSARESKKDEAREEKLRSREMYKQDYEAIVDAAEDCDDEETKADKSACVIDSFMDITNETISYKVKNSKGEIKTKERYLNEKAVRDYFVKKIQPDLKAQLRNVNRNPYTGAPSASERATETIGEILAGIPGEFNDTRTEALATTTSALYDATLRYRQAAVQAMQSRTPQDEAIAFRQKATAVNMFQSLNNNNYVSLNEAAQRGFIDENQFETLYQDGFYRTASAMSNGSRRWMGVSNQNGRAIYNLNEYQLSSDINGQTDLNLNTDLNGRIGANRNGVLPAPGQNQNVRGNSGALVAPQMLQRGSSNGAEFGQPRGLTDAARLEADRRALLQQGDASY